ncbi:hypothetical protein BV22DRAFT_1036477 [Leucogyrophana mollusca]|uniref:Uncharacterized protein n=1 Tax=Leucogyrophana mollusca TaxID=85980 RepID=A0ACB8BCE3_9AGAM|nr:hypothetical protein BV22DRAFT_1036477 [Leucogyrophana mollusca]
MHRCLLVDEILVHVIQLLLRTSKDDRRYIPNRRDVARLARTCQCFKEPALDILWRTLGSLGPLYLLLSEDAYEFCRENHIHPQRKLSPSELARVKVYSHRIRCITADPASSKSKTFPLLDMDALSALLEDCSLPSLLPSLTTIDFSLVSTSAPESCYLLREMLSPKLTSLHFRVSSKVVPESLKELLEAIPTEAPNLVDLSITRLPYITQTDFRLFDIRHLRCLSIDRSVRLDNHTLARLACLPHLVDLAFALHQDIDYGSLFPSAIRREEGFAKLQSVKITAGTNVTQWPSFFAIASCAHLEDISITYDNQCTASSFNCFLGILRSAYSTPSTLRSLVVRHDVHGDSNGEAPFMFGSSVFEPLLAFTHLKKVHFVNLGTYDLDDVFLAAAARAWPKVEELQFASFFGEIDPRVTLGSLIPFAKYCKGMRSLHMFLDASVVPSLSATEAVQDDAKNPLFIVLALRNLNMTDVHGVANFLFTLFPRLATLFPQAPLEVSERWREVAGLIKGMQETTAH